jgi:hypothetical protein
MTDKSIIDEIKQILDSLSYGSVEVIVQDGQVTQISTRIIKKTKTVTKNITSARVKKHGQSGVNVNFKY